ncbi:MAG: hypothetical protein DWI58_21515 [Chloroflexi bacterium]|nr:MAG: hypothetical protein DWI58_21515 [Chloroflexota bacterium]
MTRFDAPDPTPSPGGSRRRFLRFAFFGAIGTSFVGAAGMVLQFLMPRSEDALREFYVDVGTIGDYPLGGPPLGWSTDGRDEARPALWVVNLDPAETRPGGSGGGEGLIAFSPKCPHLGCTLRWLPSFKFENDLGWFRCDCHGGTHTKAGVRVFGPAPRSMDTMRVEIDRRGNVRVHIREIRPGGNDNPKRAVKPPA